jgi:hypothetical protein
VKLHHVPAGLGVAAFCGIVERVRPPVAVLDSVQAVAGELPGPQGDAVRALHELSRATGTCVVLLSQMNAAGTMRGSKAIEQWPDAILRIACPPLDQLTPAELSLLDVVEGEALCVIRVDGKNRHGSPHAVVRMKHTARGLRAVGGLKP